MAEPDRKGVSLEFFRLRLSALMQAHGYNIKTLSEAIGITRPTLSRYLDGQRQPELIYVMKIAQYFGVTTDWLLGMSEEKFDDRADELMELMNLYVMASDGDKSVVRAILSKYRGQDRRYDP